MAYPMQAAVRATSTAPGTSHHCGARSTSKRALATMTPTTKPGSARAVQIARSARRKAILGTGRVRIQSRLPSVRDWETHWGVMMSPSEMSAIAGPPPAR